MRDPASTAAAYDESEFETSIVDRFERMAALMPENVVITTESETVTYGQLNRSANVVANWLVGSTGLRRTPIGLMFEHGPDAVTALVGVLKSGNLYCPLDPAYPEARLAHIVEDTQMPLVLCDESNLAFAREIAGESVQVVCISRLPEDTPDANPEVAIEQDDYAYLIYTSGSTGQPKGVIENHRDVKWFTRTFSWYDDVASDDVLTAFWSLNFSGSATSLYLSLLIGASMLMADPKKLGARRVLELMRSKEVTVSSMGPPLFRQLVQADTTSEGIPGLRTIRFGGSTADRSDLINAFSWSDGIRVRHSYGMSEVKHLCSYVMDSPEQVPPGESVPIGYECDGVEIMLVDEAGNEVPQGEIGEILVKSRFVGPGYWNRPEETAAKIYGQPNGQPERFMRTGDMGMRDEKGCLFHKGRKDFQTKFRGYRIELEEIEAIMRAGEDVDDAGVFVHTANGHEDLVGVFVKDSGFESVNSLRSRMASALPAHMVPTRYIESDSIPATESGKINRRALEALASDMTEQTVPVATESDGRPLTDTESRMARIWADALRRDGVGLDEDFFEIGGDSLMAAVMVDQIFRVFGKRVPINTLFEAPTVSTMAAHIEGLDPRPSPIVPIRPSGSETPIFCFHSLGGSVLGYYALARHLPASYPVWAVQPKGTDGTEPPIEQIQDMARFYCDEITRVHSDGPFILTGISLGAEVAFEVARELRARNRDVERLVLIDAATPLPRPVSLASRLFSRAKKLRQSAIYSLAMRRHGRLSTQQARNRIYQNNIRAGRIYKSSHPEPVDVPASLIRAKYKGEYYMSEAAVSEWQRLVGGIDDIHEVNGAHQGEDYVLDEPNVGAAAAAFLESVEPGTKPLPGN